MPRSTAWGVVYDEDRHDFQLGFGIPEGATPFRSDHRILRGQAKSHAPHFSKRSLDTTVGVGGKFVGVVF